MLLSLLGVLLSEHRTGLACIIVFCATQLVRQPKILAASIPFALLVTAQIDYTKMNKTLTRSATLLSIHEGDALSGRPQIWGAHLDHLNELPLRWIAGAGAGASRSYATGSNGHNMFIEVAVEFGLIGLAFFLYILFCCLYMLYRKEKGAKPMFWTTAVLIITGFTQDTFNPVTYQGHFIGLYLLAFTIVTRQPLTNDDKRLK